MVCAGLITIFFSILGYLEYRQLWVYCILWSLNGFAQACGWPSNLAIMNNWFGKKSRGLIFSAWSSNANVGNILGAIICGIIFGTYSHDKTVWQLCMLVCGLGAIIGAIPIFLFLVPKPYYEPITTSAVSSEADIPAAPERGNLKRFTSSMFFAHNPSSSSASTSPPVKQSTGKTEKEVTDVQKFDSETPSKPAPEFSLQEIDEDHDLEDGHVKKPQSTPMKLKSTKILPYETISEDVETSAPDSKDTQKSKPETSAVASYLRVLSLGLCTRGVLPYMMIYACTKGVVYVFMYWMPLFLTSSKGISNSSAAVLSALFDLGGFLGGISSGYVTDLIGSRTLVIIFMTSSSLVVTWVLFSPSISQEWLIATSLFLIGVSIGGAQVLISASVALDLGDTAVEKKTDGKDATQQPKEGKSSPQKEDKPSGLAGTVSGLIEGSGSAGAALLQYLVGQLVTCTTEKNKNGTEMDDDGDNVVCSWYSILLVITASILFSLTCLLYIKFSNSLVQIWRKYSSK